MTTASAQQSILFDSISPLTRILNRDQTLHALAQAASNAGNLPVDFLRVEQSTPNDDSAYLDYAQLDPALTVTPPADPQPPAPRIGLAYAGFTPEQRALFLEWLQQPTNPAPPAFQILHLAHIETTLFEQNSLVDDAQLILRYLHESEHWETSTTLSRVMLLALWMQQDGTKLIEWIAMNRVHVDLLGIALGHAALLGQILTPSMLRVLMQKWQITETPLDGEMARVRLSSLTSTLGAEPLAYALKEIGEEATTTKPWRSAHRDLRIALPQPDLRPILAPLLNEIGSLSASTISLSSMPISSYPEPDDDQSNSDNDTKEKWNLVLEFQQSRSEYFDFTLHKARQRPGYSQLMDENRQIVYRITFLKREMRHFWSLWEYVQSWSGTEVYVNGKTVEKWKIWPYSQYLR